MDNLAAALQRVFGEVVPDKPPSLSVGAQPPSNARAIQDDDIRVDIGDKKGKEKVEEKRKEPIFFKGIPLVDLDDCDVSDNRLHCNNDDLDDDDAPNLEYMDADDDGVSSSQCLELLQSLARIHSDFPSKATPSGIDLFFNAVRKAPHPDAVIVK